MNLKNNKKKAKYKDVKKLYETLHSSARLSKAQAWQEELERVFDVDVFLKWLAAKRVMENWDTYGRAPHNFYLYKNPTSKRLSWIPWDNNEALRSPKQPASLDFSETTANDHWPLISFLLKQPEYKQKYLNYVRVFSSELFSTTKMNRKYAQYKALLKPFIALEAKNGFSVSSEADFEQAIAYLYNHVQRRNQAVEAYFADAK